MAKFRFLANFRYLTLHNYKRSAQFPVEVIEVKEVISDVKVKMSLRNFIYKLVGMYRGKSLKFSRL